MEFKFRISFYKAAAAEFITKHRHRPISNIAKSSLPLHRPIVGCQGRNGKELQLKNVIFSSVLLFSFQQEQQSSSGSKVWLYFKCWGNFKLSNLRSRFWAGSGSIRGRRHSFFKVLKVFTNLQLHYFSTSSPFISLTWGLISPWLVTKQKILDRKGPIVSKTPWAIKKGHVWACQRIAHLNIFESGFNSQEGGLILKQTMPRCRRSHRISFSWSRKFGLEKTQARNERLRNTCGWNARWRRHFLNVVQ